MQQPLPLVRLQARTRVGAQTVFHSALSPARPSPPQQPPVDQWCATVRALLEALTKAGGDVAEALTAVDAEGRTPLHLALWRGAPLPLVQLLLSAAPAASGLYIGHSAYNLKQFDSMHGARFEASTENRAMLVYDTQRQGSFGIRTA